MNILQIGSYLYPDLVGGAEISARNVHEVLMAAGHRVIGLRSSVGAPSAATRIVQDDDGNWRAEAWRPMRPIEVGSLPAKAIYYALEFIGRLDRVGLARLVQQERIDIVMVHSLRGIGYDLLSALADLNLPTAFFLHDLALVCLNKSMVRKGVICKRPCSQCRLVAATSRRALARFDRVVLVGPSAQIARRVGAELDLPGVELIHLPNPNRYDIAPRVRGGENRPFTVGYIGRLDREKGVAGLLPTIDRVAASRPVRFLVAGKGALDEEVREFAATRPWVDFRGFVELADTAAVYDAVDVLVLPSLWPENFPGAAVQAITSGSPVVGFAIGGIPEIVEDGASGRLVPFGDFDALGDAIGTLADDTALLRQLSEGAVAAAQRYNPAILASRLLELVERMGQRRSDAA